MAWRISGISRSSHLYLRFLQNLSGDNKPCIFHLRFSKKSKWRNAKAQSPLIKRENGKRKWKEPVFPLILFVPDSGLCRPAACFPLVDRQKAPAARSLAAAHNVLAAQRVLCPFGLVFPPRRGAEGMSRGNPCEARRPKGALDLPGDTWHNAVAHCIEKSTRHKSPRQIPVCPTSRKRLTRKRQPVLVNRKPRV